MQRTDSEMKGKREGKATAGKTHAKQSELESTDTRQPRCIMNAPSHHSGQTSSPAALAPRLREFVTVDLMKHGGGVAEAHRCPGRVC